MASFLVLYHAPDTDTSAGSVRLKHSQIASWLSEISSSVLYSSDKIKEGIKITEDGIRPVPSSQKINNYVILQADDKDQALELSRTAPTIYEGGSAEVYEINDEN